jgi:4-amino-4-deoxy-L-arabinose transferase-like glycosyltransferase
MVFPETGFLRVFFLLIPALLSAYALSRLTLSGPRAYAFLFILSLASVLPLWTEPEAVLDAARYFIQAKSMKEHGAGFFLKEWGNAVHAWTDMPLVPFLYGLVFSWIGEARVYIQALNSCLFALTVLLTYLLGKRLWDEETGLHAGILLMGIPYLLTQVPLLLVDVPTMFFLTLSIFCFLRAAEQGGLAWTAGSALAICAALFPSIRPGRCFPYRLWPSSS